jgi:hypothetical protein
MDYPKANSPSLSEMTGRIGQDLGLLREAAARRSDELRRAARSFIDEHPYAAVGAAFAVGYLLAGGLFSRFSARTFGFGARLLLGRALKQVLTQAGTD